MHVTSLGNIMIAYILKANRSVIKAPPPVFKVPANSTYLIAIHVQCNCSLLNSPHFIHSIFQIFFSSMVQSKLIRILFQNSGSGSSPEFRTWIWSNIRNSIVGQIPGGHLTTISAKVAIKMVKLSNYFGKNLWCTFNQMLNEKKKKNWGNKNLGSK